jgi:HD-like signal output (HDOD) protein
MDGFGTAHFGVLRWYPVIRRDSFGLAVALSISSRSAPGMALLAVSIGGEVGDECHLIHNHIEYGFIGQSTNNLTAGLVVPYQVMTDGHETVLADRLLEVLMHDHRHWGLPQWVAFLRTKDIPIMPRSKMFIEALDGERVSPKEMAGIVMCDPFLGLRLLRRAEGHRSGTLGHDTTTILGAVQQVGVDGLVEAAEKSELCDDNNMGLVACEARAVLSASIALHWAANRADLSPEEVAFAALLGEIGELMLWAFAPELPLAALDEMRSGRATRNAQAQSQAVGFGFKQLSLGLIEAWGLPLLIGQLVKGADTPRANIARIASDAARHIQVDPENPALPSDVAAVRAFLPGVPLENLLASLPISDEYRELVLAAVRTANGGAN